MFFDALYEFSVIEQSGSMHEAAALLGVSQPTLGRHLSALEAELGCTLATRDRDGVRVTAQGRYLLEKARNVRSMEDAIVRYYADPHARTMTRIVTIGTVERIPAVESAIRKACATKADEGYILTVHIEEADSLERAVSLLEDHRLDIVLFVDDPSHSASSKQRHQTVFLGNAALYVAFPPGGPFTGQDQVSLARVGNLTFENRPRARDERGTVWGAFRTLCATEGLSPSSAPSYREHALPAVLVTGPSLPGPASQDARRLCAVTDASVCVMALCRDDDVIRDVLGSASALLAR